MKISIDKQKSFVDYFISKVYVLPIVLKDDDLDVARSNALMVFETINDNKISHTLKIGFFDDKLLNFIKHIIN